jgi:hypothetical protein
LNSEDGEEEDVELNNPLNASRQTSGVYSYTQNSWFYTKLCCCFGDERSRRHSAAQDAANAADMSEPLVINTRNSVFSSDRPTFSNQHSSSKFNYNLHNASTSPSRQSSSSSGRSPLHKGGGGGSNASSHAPIVQSALERNLGELVLLFILDWL